MHNRVFTISNPDEGAPVNVVINGLTIRDGRSSEGGGVMLQPLNTLTLNDCVIGPNNIVTYAGGGIFNNGGTLTLNGCTVTENEGTGSLGGAGVTTVGFGFDGTTTLINTTISGNITNNYGGGIYVAYDGVVNLIHSTISANISNENYLNPGEERGGGAGIYIDVEGVVNLQNSIVAGNEDWTDPATALHEKWPDVYGNFTSLGGNIIGDTTGSTNTWGATDRVGTALDPIDPMLEALALNAPGSTPTMALMAGSPALDKAPTCALTTDQRGVGRPQGSACDIGAYELEQAQTMGSLRINKVFAPLTSGFTGLFAINYDCDDGTAHDGTVTLAAGGSETISGIPTGTSCTVTEPNLPIAPTGWSFGTPTFSPVNGTVIISETLAEVTVTNTISEDLVYYLFLPIVTR
jgi:hypothetical protein